MPHDLVPRATTNHAVKFVDDTTVMGLIRDDHGLGYREEVEQLVGWCSKNDLILNVDKTKENIVNFRKKRPSQASLLNNSNAAVEVVSSTKLLGVHITDNLTWSVNTAALVEKAQQRLHFLRRMSRALLPATRPHYILQEHHREHPDQLHLYVVWKLQRNVRRVVRTAEKIIKTSLPSTQDIAPKCCMSRAGNIIRNSSHPHHGLFSVLLLQHSVQDHKAL